MSHSFDRTIHRYSKMTLFWLVLLITALLPFSLALIFQHGMGLPPCVLCIYQRLALLGIVLAALLVFCAPKCRFLRGIGLLLWLYSATRGLLVAWEQTQRYLYPLRFNSCDFRVRFPNWLPLDEWAPQIFRAYSACDVVDWSFCGLNMPQWMVLLFAVHMLVSLLVLVSQYCEWRRHVKHQYHQKKPGC